MPSSTRWSIVPDPERVSETKVGGFTEADVEAGARAFIASRLDLEARYTGWSRDVVQVVLDAVGSRSTSAPTDEDAIRADERHKIVEWLRDTDVAFDRHVVIRAIAREFPSVDAGEGS